MMSQSPFLYTFQDRHIGPRDQDIQDMLHSINHDSLDDLIDEIVPESIRLKRPLQLPEGLSEEQALIALKTMAQKNKIYTNLIGQGYYDCYTPTVILRNILENPGWYTQYTPYQAEISQGRLEALVNFQTVVSDLTGLPLSNSSLLDESTAAAEAMSMAWGLNRKKGTIFWVDQACHPQTIAVLQTRAKPLNIEIKLAKRQQMNFSQEGSFGVLLQYPDTYGEIEVNLSDMSDKAHQNKITVVVASDLLALTLLTPPGELGADIVIGNSQRLGVPLGAGGPHAAFMSTHEKNKRVMPGRIIGLSVGQNGERAYRLALQTREQHIRRDKATSNICTAQVLLAIMAGMYAVYHGPQGLRKIAIHVKKLADTLVNALGNFAINDLKLQSYNYFDTITFDSDRADLIIQDALNHEINLRKTSTGFSIAFDETCDIRTVELLLQILVKEQELGLDLQAIYQAQSGEYTGHLQRQSDYLTHPTFHRYHSEHELLRYMQRLQSKDLSLVHSMIPLGSCTMKLNASTEMIPVTWPEFANIHPFAPLDQQEGYAILYTQLEEWLAEITGFKAISLQPNAGSQGEYAGLLVIKAYHEARQDFDRTVCLIPTSAHGTNPASAVMAGFKVVAVQCDEQGDIDLQDLANQVDKYKERLASIMVTYPSTHGVFEEGIVRACALVHAAGGQVYMDGANMNAQVGLCRPGDFGADVCHLNLHKTFCIPHGGGGPGMGPIGVAAHLVPYLPTHPVHAVGGAALGSELAIGPVSAAPYGSPAILPISYAYIMMMGATGLKKASEIAILNANYMATRLSEHYDILFTGNAGRVAHEFILDCRPFKVSAKITVDDIAKRLMDYGFHAPTMSWPVAGTLMVEPTESESKEELDRFCDAMIAIRQEIHAIEQGDMSADDNPLKFAPHTITVSTADEWPHTYSRQLANYPLAWIRERKFWASVSRVDNAYGDRNLVCTCPPLSAYQD
jgi:glycine dehydrogenase